MKRNTTLVYLLEETTLVYKQRFLSYNSQFEMVELPAEFPDLTQFPHRSAQPSLMRDPAGGAS